MCLSELGRVVAVDPERRSATVDADGRVVRVSTVTLGLDEPPPALGDWLVVHTGFAVERLDEAAARDILRTRRALSRSAPDGDPEERS